MAWIRSQDGKDLSDVKSIWINGKTIVACLFNYEDRFTIGDFPNEKAAIAELDRFESWLTDRDSNVFQVAPGGGESELQL